MILRRYAASTRRDLSHEIRTIHIYESKAAVAESPENLLGYEGQGAKTYFAGLAKCVDKVFAFKGRNRRPPRDPFNSMLSLGYSILMNELYGEIESRGMNPYFGFFHKDAENHPTLASDMMEEWRAVIVDTMVMALINGHEVQPTGFEYGNNQPGCYLMKDTLQIFLRKMEHKLQVKAGYLDYVDYPVSFRRAISIQMQKLEEAVRQEDPGIYHPVRIR